MREECSRCGEETGRAGPLDDSLYLSTEFGPYCENCWPMEAGEDMQGEIDDLRARLRSATALVNRVEFVGAPGDERCPICHGYKYDPCGSRKVGHHTDCPFRHKGRA